MDVLSVTFGKEDAGGFVVQNPLEGEDEHVHGCCCNSGVKKRGMKLVSFI